MLMTENDFYAKTNKELIDLFNKDVGNPGWVAARGRFHTDLLAEFKKRNFNYSDIGGNVSISFAHKIILKGSKIEVIKE